MVVEAPHIACLRCHNDKAAELVPGNGNTWRCLDRQACLKRWYEREMSR